MTTIEKVTDDEAPALRHLMRVFSPDCEPHYVDADEPVECALLDLAAGRVPGTVADLVSQIQAELDAYGHDSELLESRLSMYVALPAAGTWVAWWRYLATWLPDAAGQPTLVRGMDNFAPLPRASRFTDQETANRAVTQVLRAEEERFRAWAADPRAPRRLHLYADLGHDVGVVMARGADGNPVPSAPAGACAVTMSRNPSTGEAWVAAAYPEIVLPTGARRRYPDLPQLFGAYFGQDYAGLDTHRWRAEWRFNIRLTADLRDRTADQLRDLLAGPDEALRSDVEALGSYVLPTQLRRWVTGLLRRITVPDWTPPPGFVDPVTR